MARSGSCTAHMMGCRRSRRRSGRSSGRRQRHAAPTPVWRAARRRWHRPASRQCSLAVLITGHDLEPIAAQVTGLAELDRLAKHPGAARPPIGHVPDCPHRAGSPDLAGGDDTGGVVQQGAQRTGRCRRGAQRRRNDAKTQHARSRRREFEHITPRDRHMPQGTTKTTTVTLVSVVTDASHWQNTCMRPYRHRCGLGQAASPCDHYYGVIAYAPNGAMGKIVAPPHSRPGGYRRIRTLRRLSCKVLSNFTNYHGESDDRARWQNLDVQPVE